MTLSDKKKALSRLSAFFIAWVLSLFTPLVSANCAVNHYDEAAIVKYVTDGDTIVLKDKRKVRLIGINTPEIGYYPKKSEPFADRAKKFVEAVLSNDKKVSLRFGTQSKDRYGRLLAHIFLSDGRNLNAMLLENGLASVIAIPPNLKMLECYKAKERDAKLKNKNIWSSQYSQYLDANQIQLNQTGFNFIKGNVIRIGRSKDSIWLQLAKKFTIRIKRKDFKYFPNIKFNSLTLQQIGKRSIYVRGWVYKRKGELYIQAHHAAMLIIK